MVEWYDKVLVLSILDHVDCPYIFSMLLAFSRIFKTMLSHCGSVSPLIQPSKIRYFWIKSWTLTKGMNEVSIHVSYIFGNKQNSKNRYIRKDITEDRGAWIQERPVVGSNRPERQN